MAMDQHDGQREIIDPSNPLGVILRWPRITPCFTAALENTDGQTDITTGGLGYKPLHLSTRNKVCMVLCVL